MTQFLTQHAHWAASARRSNLPTDGSAFNFNRVQLTEILALSGFEDGCFEIEM